MKTNNKGFYLFFDWIDDLDTLGSDGAWKIVKAICEYYRTGANPVEALDGPLRTVAAIMFRQIKRGEQISEVRRAAGQRGGFAKANNSKESDLLNQNVATYYELHNTNNQSLFLSGASAHTRERESSDVAEPLSDRAQVADEAPEADEDEDEDQDDELLPPDARAKLEAHLKEQLKQKYLGGDLGKGIVMMNDVQFSALCEDLSIEELEKYMGIIVDCETGGKHYRRKTHYQAILDMAEKDRRTQGGINYGR